MRFSDSAPVKQLHVKDKASGRYVARQLAISLEFCRGIVTHIHDLVTFIFLLLYALYPDLIAFFSCKPMGIPL